MAEEENNKIPDPKSDKIPDTIGNQIQTPPDKKPDRLYGIDTINPNDFHGAERGEPGFGINVDEQTVLNTVPKKPAFDALSAIQRDQADARRRQLEEAKTEEDRKSAVPEANQPQNTDPAKKSQDQSQDQPKTPQEPSPEQKDGAVNNLAKKAEAAKNAVNPANAAENSSLSSLKIKALKYLRIAAEYIAGDGLPIVSLIFVAALAVAIVRPAAAGTEGLTTGQPASTVGNKSLVNKLSLLTGDQTANKTLTLSVLLDAKKDLLSLKETVSDTSIKTKIDTATAAIDKYSSTPSSDLGKSIVDQIKTILAACADNIAVTPIFAGTSRLPVDQSVIDNVAKNKPGNWAGANIDHGWTLRNHDEVSYEGKGHGTYLHPGSNWSKDSGLPADIWGDALDIPADGATVYAPFNGTIVKAGGGGENPILIKSKDDPQTFAVMGNVSGRPSSGDVTVGQKLGTISGHLHFELWINNRPITSGATFNKPRFWLNMKTAMNIK